VLGQVVIVVVVVVVLSLMGSDGDGFLIICQVQDNYRFGRGRHTDPGLDHNDPNPATLAPRILLLSTVSQSG
jgi:hypothetical protein